MTSHYQALITRFDQFITLLNLQEFLEWDEAVMMPVGGSDQRNEAIALLEKLMQNLLSDPDAEQELAKAQLEELSQSEKRNYTLMQSRCLEYNFGDKGLGIDIAKANKVGEQVWRTCRANNDWESFRPYLERVVELQLRKAECLSEKTGKDPYDNLIAHYCPDLTQAEISPLFDTLKSTLPALVQRLSSPSTKDQHLTKNIPIKQQQALLHDVIRIMGFDEQCGRLDVSSHPFSSGTASDVRITTRYDENYFLESLTGVFHETGHALYEQQLPDRSPKKIIDLSYGMVVHESQSLLMEKFICCSQPFLDFLTPAINQHFSTQFNAQSLYAALHCVAPGLIRTQADSVTYPLHIIIRYEIEQALFNKSITVKDLPAVWNEKVQAYLGLQTDSDANGVMQDVHWAGGDFGYFPAYALGLLLAAQLFESLQENLPTMKADLASGQFHAINDWLKQGIHQQGSSRTFNELVSHATKAPLQVDAYLRHIDATIGRS